MDKSQFVRLMSTLIIPNDKPYNRQLWNYMLDHFKSELPKRAGAWVKTPKKYYGEVNNG